MSEEAGTVMEVSAVAEERELIRRSQAGEREAFGALVREYMDRAYRATYVLVGNHADAAELSQEAFARAYRALDSFNVQCPFYPWFYRILRNVAYDRLRRRHLEPVATDPTGPAFAQPVASDADDPAVLAERREAAQALQEALAQLPSGEREVTWLKLVEGLSYRAIGEQVGVSQATVAARVAAARKKLRQQLGSYL